MTVETLTNYTEALGNGVATEFPFYFYLTDTSYLIVEQTVDDVTTTVSASLYSVDGVGDAEGGTVEFLTPPADGAKIVMRREVPYTQSLEVLNQGGFYPESVEEQLDLMVQQTQQLADLAGRAAVIPRPYDSAVGLFPVVLPSGTFGFSSGTGADSGLRADLGTGNGEIVGYQADLPDAVWQDLRDRLMEEVSVKTFGAKTDGTDSLAAINKAIAEAPANGVLRFTAGVYHVSGNVVIDRDDLTIVGPGAVLKAMDGTSFEYVLNAVDVDRVYIHDLTFDANQANRTSGQDVRFCGARFALSRDVGYYRCRAINALGYASTPGVGLIHSGCTRGNVSECRAVDCGGTSGTNAADGIYVSGDNMLISNCITENCTDTGQVLENCNNSGIVGGTTKNCNATFAITNATNFTKRGNFIKGCTGIDWNSSVTGGVQISCFGTGDLLDTSVEVTLVVVTGGKGIGPAISVRKTSTGKVDGADIDPIINGASTQGVLVDGINIRVNGGFIRGATNACVQFQDGATGEVNGCRLKGGTFGVYAAGTANVHTCGNYIEGNGTQSYGLYAADTSTILSNFDKIDGQTSFRTGKDGGATMQSSRFTGTAIELNGTQIIGAQGAAVADATGGVTVDTEARAALNALLARLRTHGLIAS